MNEFLSLINEKSHSLAKIVDDLLQLGKIASGRELYLEVEPYDLSVSIRRIVDAFQKKTAQHRFVVNLLDEDVVIVADRHRLGQVFDNLLSNAIKYSPGERTRFYFTLPDIMPGEESSRGGCQPGLTIV